MMKPVNLEIQQRNELESSCLEKAGTLTLGGRKGWARTCPANAEEANEIIKETEKAGAGNNNNLLYGAEVTSDAQSGMGFGSFLLIGMVLGLLVGLFMAHRRSSSASYPSNNYVSVL